MKSKITPRNPAPSLSILQSTRLLGGQLSSLRLPGVYRWGQRHQRHTAAFHKYVPRIPEEEKGQVSAFLPFESPGPNLRVLQKYPAPPANPVLFPGYTGKSAPPSATTLTFYSTRAAVTSGFPFNQEPEEGRRAFPFVCHSLALSRLCTVTSPCHVSAQGQGICHLVPH